MHTDRRVNVKHTVLIDSGAVKCQKRHRSYRGALWNSDVLEIMIVPNLALCVCVCMCVVFLILSKARQKQKDKETDELKQCQSC